MMGNFFNNMHYGKGRKGDYTKEDLPENRWKLFFSMAKLNLSKLVTLNLLFLVFFLPTYLWVFYMNLPLISEAMGAGDTNLAVTLFVQCIYGMSICFLILGPGLTGLTYVTRNMAMDQNVWIWADFWGAIKTNWKQMIAVSLMNGAVLILAYIGAAFYGGYTAVSSFYVLPQALVLVMAAIWFLMNFYIWPMMVTYELGLKAIIKNAFLVAIAKLPQTLFMAVFTLTLPVAYLLSGNVYTFMIIMLLYVLIGFSLNGLAVNSVTNGIFDRYINSRIKGAQVNRGLRVTDDEDEDFETENDG